jgi:hypothetical protein
MTDTYQIDRPEDITIGEVARVETFGADEVAVLANGSRIQLGVPLCCGCDSAVGEGLDPCGCEE